MVILPRFELDMFLQTVQKHKIEFLHLVGVSGLLGSGTYTGPASARSPGEQVPPIVLQMLRNEAKCRQYDLRSVAGIFSGAAPLGAETQQALARALPGCRVSQGYGLTETSTVVSVEGENDILVGSSGVLVPALRAKLVDPDGHEITAHGQAGELWVQGPNVTLGYLNNEKATAEAYAWDDDGRWLRTGDVALARTSPAGHEHFFIVDRLKELIKVKVRPLASRLAGGGPGGSGYFTGPTAD